MTKQNLGKGITVRKAEKARKALEPSALGRHRLRLRVVHHLKSVLARTQEAGGRLHVVARRCINPAVLFELVESGERVAIAQVRIASPRDQLLGLREELD